MQKLLIIIGLVVFIIGLLYPYLKKLPIGRLPGDIFINSDKFSFAFPIATCIIISIVLSIIFIYLNKWLELNRWRCFHPSLSAFRRVRQDLALGVGTSPELLLPLGVADSGSRNPGVHAGTDPLVPSGFHCTSAFKARAVHDSFQVSLI